MLGHTHNFIFNTGLRQHFLPYIRENERTISERNCSRFRLSPRINRSTGCNNSAPLFAGSDRFLGTIAFLEVISRDYAFQCRQYLIMRSSGRDLSREVEVFTVLVLPRKCP